MSIETTVKAQAVDTKSGMTLDELGAFVQQAMREGVPGSTIVRIECTWRSSIKKARATGSTEEAS